MPKKWLTLTIWFTLFLFFSQEKLSLIEDLKPRRCKVFRHPDTQNFRSSKLFFNGWQIGNSTAWAKFWHVLGTSDRRPPRARLFHEEPTSGSGLSLSHRSWYPASMARPLRLELPGALYHITSRGDGREDIFLSDDDRLAWLETLT